MQHPAWVLLHRALATQTTMHGKLGTLFTVITLQLSVHIYRRGTSVLSGTSGQWGLEGCPYRLRPATAIGRGLECCCCPTGRVQAVAEAEGGLGLGSCLGPQCVAEALEKGAFAFARAVLRCFAIFCLGGPH